MGAPRPIGSRRLNGPQGKQYWQIKVRHGHRGWVYEHRHIMEQIIGRPLSSSEHVHHINEDRQDNRAENLQMLSANEHARHHCLKSGRIPPVTRKKSEGSWSLHHVECIKCGTNERDHGAHGLCSTCYMSARRDAGLDRPPPGTRNTRAVWSRRYHACIECGTTEVKHNARGLCFNCYMRWFNGRASH